MRRPRTWRAVGTLVVTGLALAYIVWKVDLRTTAHVLANASAGWWLASFGIWVVSVWPLSWRWGKLLAASGVHERLGWLVRTTFVAYAAAQILPTSLGGDASRIYETARRHPGSRGPVAGTVLLERALGGAATLLLAAVGFLLALGHYSVGGYVWVELAFVLLSILGAFVLFSTRLHPILHRLRPVLAALAGRGGPARRVSRGPRLPDAAAAARRGVRAHARGAGGARARDLVRRQGRGSRALAAAVLRDGAAALPRHAHPVHDQRARRQGVVLRELPRQLSASRPTRRSRRASSSSSSR